MLKKYIEKVEELRQQHIDEKRELETKFEEDKNYILDNTIEHKQEEQIKELERKLQEDVNSLKSRIVAQMEQQRELGSIEIERVEIAKDKDKILESEMYIFNEKRKEENQILRDKKLIETLEFNNILQLINVSSDSVEAILEIIKDHADNLELLQRIELVTKNIDTDNKIRYAISDLTSDSPKQQLKVLTRDVNTFKVLDNANVSQLMSNSYFK